MTDDIIHITEQSELYPPLLREIRQPPTDLYIRGNPNLLALEPMLAVVGSRRASHQGKNAVQTLLTPAVQSGVPLVSGLAFGIDSMAHQVCVSNNVPTIAVLGGSVDDASIYPKKHIALAHEIIAKGGAMISEYAPDTPPHLGQFPARNRIIAGLTKATLIVQAAEKSGSLITARLAMETNRDVAAVPGAINDSLAWGTNRLIRDGAMPILEPQDIFDLLGVESTVALDASDKRFNNLTIEQQLILKLLSDKPTHADQLVAQAKLTSPVLLVAVTELEMLDLIEHVGGHQYIKKN